MQQTRPKTLLDRLLSLFSSVEAGEGVGVLLLVFNLFLLLVSYYVLKTVREPLIIASGGAAYKTYASAAQALVLVGFVPAYGWIAGRVSRIRLLAAVTLFFVLCIEGFYAAAQLGVPYLGIAFYVWVGIFSVAIIAQFWSYANDLYEREAGERLFPIVAIGATVGSAVGAKLAGSLFDLGFEPFTMLHVAGALLLATLGVYVAIERLQSPSNLDDPNESSPAMSGPGGFSLVFRSPYLGTIAVLLILLNMVNTTGEFVLASMVEQAAHAAVAADPSVSVDQFIGSFYGDYFFWVNTGTVVIQSFLVSRLVRYTGLAGALLALPLVAMGAYGLIAGGVGLGLVRWAKSAENMTDYSVMNTAKAMLWLPTTREEKYKAKAAIDTFFVRSGDVLSALLVFAGTTAFALGSTGFALVNLGLILIWIGVAVRLYRLYQAKAAAEPETS